MKTAEERRLDAAGAAIQANNTMRGLEHGNAASTDLYHLLHSLLEWCDVCGVDFDETLSCLRADLREEG